MSRYIPPTLLKNSVAPILTRLSVSRRNFHAKTDRATQGSATLTPVALHCATKIVLLMATSASSLSISIYISYISFSLSLIQRHSNNACSLAILLLKVASDVHEEGDWLAKACHNVERIEELASSNLGRDQANARVYEHCLTSSGA